MNYMDKRNKKLINALSFLFWWPLRRLFSIKITGKENIPKSSFLIIANHNSGALIESHSLLFGLKEFEIYGFNHPSLFKIPFIGQYFYKIGAIPATYEAAEEVFKNKKNLLIFPGGNRQALRTIFDYKKNSFPWAHGWAKIAIQNKVQVVPVTFEGSHFVNPIFFCNEWISKILVLPWLLGTKWFSISLAQIIFSYTAYALCEFMGVHLTFKLLITYLVYCFSALGIILPSKITLKIHPSIISHDQKDLECRVEKIMDSIYKN